jgi:hypothetical protein
MYVCMYAFNLFALAYLGVDQASMKTLLQTTIRKVRLLSYIMSDLKIQ